jgi:hypothetical protein
MAMAAAVTIDGAAWGSVLESLRVAVRGEPERGCLPAETPLANGPIRRDGPMMHAASMGGEESALDQSDTSLQTSVEEGLSHQQRDSSKLCDDPRTGHCQLLGMIPRSCSVIAARDWNLASGG